MPDAPTPIDYASPYHQSPAPSKFTVPFSLLLFALTTTLFLHFWNTKHFIPIHRDVLRPHTLTYFDALFGDFLDLWTSIFFAFPILAIALLFIYLRRRRTPIAWIALALNILTLTALVIFSITARDYPRIRIPLPTQTPAR